MRCAAFLAAFAFAFLGDPTPAQEGPLPVIVMVEPLTWAGTAEVYPPGRTLKIGVRTSINDHGNVVSESWPLDLGEAKGLRRMRLIESGGTIERDGKTQQMPFEMWQEEREQFQFYRHLQLAARRAPEMAARGVNTFQVPGASRTWFRIDREGTITGAINEVHAADGTAYQTFRFDGFWISKEFVFPKHIEMTRDGKPFFTLDVTSFHAG